MKRIKLLEFAERIRQRIVDDSLEVVWFLGAGCSISSGIPAAGGLVTRWVEELHEMRAPDLERQAWATSTFATYDPACPARAYAEVFEERHPNAADRQQEIERVCARGEAAYGYATLAQIITNPAIGGRCNTVLTTNFDDLIAEAVYLYGNLGVRPQMIAHEAVARYARISLSRPTIIKLHGDAHLDPKNLSSETAAIDDAVAEHLHPFLRNSAMVFLGYGGNDRSINAFLSKCPLPGLAPPIFWVGLDDPSEDMAAWLEKREAIRVDHRDFDRVMHMLRGSLKIDHPAEDRWTRARDRYVRALQDYKLGEKAEGDMATREALERSSAASTASLSGAWGYTLRAIEAHNDPALADQIYREGVAEFPNDAVLLGNYAIFLRKIKKDYDAAEHYYRRAIAADPKHASNLGNYALFLTVARKRHDEAERLFLEAIDLEPSHAGNLGNYAFFLDVTRLDPTRAEVYYQKALQADPVDVNILGNYATFLVRIRRDPVGGEEYYRRAIEAGPKHANNLGNYAKLLLARGDVAGLALLDRARLHQPAQSESIRASLGVELAFYAYAHDERSPVEDRLAAAKALVLQGARSPGWDLSENVAFAVAQGHPHPDLLATLAAVIVNEAKVDALDTWPEWATAD